MRTPNLWWLPVVVWAVAGLLIGVTLFIVIPRLQEAPPPPEPPASQCMTGSVTFHEDTLGVDIRIGEIQLCGAGLHWTSVYGPDFAAHIKSLEDQVKEAQRGTNTE